MESFKEQEIFLLMALGVIIMLMLATAFVVFYTRFQRKLLLQKMQGQELLLQKTILAQEEERSRIAKDLHDEIGAKLSIIYLHLQRLKKASVQSTEFQPIITNIVNIINTSITSTRRIAHGLLPPTLEELGFTEALKEYCYAFTQAGSLSISLDLNAIEPIILDKLTELNLFRILQELINNSLKHGQAKSVKIHFLSVLGTLKIKYEDDGKGFDLQLLKQYKGLGMKSIESRLQIIHGTWVYRSSPGNGFQVELTLTHNL